jgi:hypothetical protein
MKKTIQFILLTAFAATSSFGNNTNYFSVKPHQVTKDTLPDMCLIIPPLFVDSLNPFGVQISGNFPDPNNYDVYKGCHYQFFTPNAKPQMAVRLIKWASKSEALDEYKMDLKRHHESWGRSPERLYWVPDSAYFTDNGEERNKCFDCGLVALNGLYTIYISFAGDDNGNRARKKTVALYILEMLCARISGLTPPRTINRQLPKIN